ncbi:MAG: hypothetical protein EBQ56_03070 [Proteobacteria bacterium]|nr:hypothetical protein [Pseudomonadota bacterium]NDB72064.1 hypothetical protein [Pseudomonadota bacterium]
MAVSAVSLARPALRYRSAVTHVAGVPGTCAPIKVARMRPEGVAGSGNTSSTVASVSASETTGAGRGDLRGMALALQIR